MNRQAEGYVAGLHTKGRVPPEDLSETERATWLKGYDIAKQQRLNEYNDRRGRECLNSKPS